jgi:hypothetical protein
MALGVVLFIVVSVLPAWLAIEAPRKGVVRARGWSYSRSEEPVLFWIAVATYMVLVEYIWFWAARLALTVGF